MCFCMPGGLNFNGNFEPVVFWMEPESSFKSILARCSLFILSLPFCQKKCDWLQKKSLKIIDSFVVVFVETCGELLKDHNAVIPQGLSFSFKDHTMPTSRFQNNNSSRRRSKSYSDLGWNRLFTSLASHYLDRQK